MTGYGIQLLLLWLMVLLATSGGEASFLSHSRFASKKPIAPSVIIYQQQQQQQRDENSEAETFTSSQQEDWRDAKILSSRPACPSGKSTIIQLQVDAATHQEYTMPGQFVQFRYKDADPIFLAIASAPATGAEKNCFEFLIKMAPRLDWLPEALVEGNTVQVTGVMGEGFPLEDLGNTKKIESIILAAAGSGIAPLKACIESGKLPSSPQNKLYYGEWKNDDLCFSELYDSWKSDLGVDVVPVLSRTEDTKGYVQYVLKQDGVALLASQSPETTGSILCGMDDMVEACTLVLTEAGVKKDNILLNL
mmetsp:Transcript_21369/g.27616  ORF Transcript_21369/g.27616 Transcript_21369/m.27616 type:complete len:306 (+) Transcript_21369:84-1001(+)